MIGFRSNYVLPQAPQNAGEQIVGPIDPNAPKTPGPVANVPSFEVLAGQPLYWWLPDFSTINQWTVDDGAGNVQTFTGGNVFAAPSSQVGRVVAPDQSFLGGFPQAQTFPPGVAYPAQRLGTNAYVRRRFKL